MRCSPVLMPWRVPERSPIRYTRRRSSSIPPCLSADPVALIIRPYSPRGCSVTIRTAATSLHGIRDTFSLRATVTPSESTRTSPCRTVRTYSVKTPNNMTTVTAPVIPCERSTARIAARIIESSAMPAPAVMKMRHIVCIDWSTDKGNRALSRVASGCML